VILASVSQKANWWPTTPATIALTEEEEEHALAAGLGLVGVAADALLAHLHLKDTKVAQLHVPPIGQSLLDDIESLLHGVDDLFLREARLPVDFQHDFTFGQVGHGESFRLMLIELKRLKLFVGL
jgi:hypothetical protein